MLRLIALALPLGLDTFAVAAAAGVAGVGRSRRLRLSLVLAAFEGGMPLVGFLLGAGVGAAAGADADYAAGALLIVLGASMLRPRDDAREQAAAEALHRARGAALAALGLSVSLDELAIGFSAGLLRLPIVLAAVLIALQAFVAAQAGLRLGARAGEGLRERAERLAAAALLVLGVVVLSARVIAA